MPVSPARAAAFDILLRVERESSYASELLHSASYENLCHSDHALTTGLVMGVLRWRSRLDEEIAGASSQPLVKLDIEILIALRLALYQFRWLTRVPARAALHESVELVKRARKRSAAPFVNAVLRKLSAKPGENRSVSDDQDSSPEVLAAAFSHPVWLVERWVRIWIRRRPPNLPVRSVRPIHDHSVADTRGSKRAHSGRDCSCSRRLAVFRTANRSRGYHCDSSVSPRASRYSGCRVAVGRGADGARRSRRR